MRIDKKDLALEHLVDDKKAAHSFVCVRGDGISYATDGYLYGEYKSGRRNGSKQEYADLSKEGIRELKKQVPTGVRAVRDGLDYVEITNTTNRSMVPTLDADSDVIKATENTPDDVYSLDPDLLAKANKFLFAGHTGTQGRKALQVRVHRAKIAGVTYPVYVLTNRNDPSRRVILAGQRETA